MAIIQHKWAIGFILFVLVLVSLPAWAGIVRVIDSGGGLLMPNVTSLKELRFKNTIRQERDFSCGSAAVATLLTYHYGNPVSEQDVFDVMFANGNKEKIEREGFSLLDMKNYLEANGYHADGYIVANLNKVAKVAIPVIVLINNGGYLHFVVVKGLDNEKVLLGDPATGTRTLPRAEFEAIWNKLVFVIHENEPAARTTFNREADWKTREKSILGAALNRDRLGTFSYMPSVLDGSPTRGF